MPLSSNPENKVFVCNLLSEKGKKAGINEVRHALSRYMTGGPHIYTGNRFEKLLNTMAQEGLLIHHAPSVRGAPHLYELAPAGKKFLEEAKNSNNYPEIFKSKSDNPGHSGGSVGPTSEAQYSDVQNLVKWVSENADQTSPSPDISGNNVDTSGFHHGLPFTSPGKGRPR